MARQKVVYNTTALPTLPSAPPTLRQQLKKELANVKLKSDFNRKDIKKWRESINNKTAFTFKYKFVAKNKKAKNDSHVRL